MRPLGLHSRRQVLTTPDRRPNTQAPEHGLAAVLRLPRSQWQDCEKPTVEPSSENSAESQRPLNAAADVFAPRPAAGQPSPPQAAGNACGLAVKVVPPVTASAVSSAAAPAAYNRVLASMNDRGDEPAAAPPPPAAAAAVGHSLDTQELSPKTIWQTFCEQADLPPAETGLSSDSTDFCTAMRTYRHQQEICCNGEAPPLSPDQCFRHSGWEDLRSRVRAALFRTNQTPSRVTAFDECGLNAWVERTIEKPHKHRLKSSFCHDRLCTPCANERSFRMRDALMTAMGDRPHSFITLTLCGKGEKLTDLIDRLYKSFTALRRHPTWESKVRGGGAFLEIKWSDKAQRWHPHLHIIADADYIEVGDLCAAWKSITKDSFIVDIRRVREKSGQARYVTKYASKPLNTSFSTSPKLLDEAVTALHRRRLCLTFGTWYNTPLDDAEEDVLDEDLASFGKWESIGGLYALHALACKGDAAALAAMADVRAYERLNRFTAGPSG